jgi:MFS family permease
MDEEAATEPPSSHDLTESDRSESVSKLSFENEKRTHLEHPRIKEMYSTADWWSLWIGLLTFAVAMIVVFAVPLDHLDSTKYAIPQPYQWEQNPLDAWDAYNLVGVPILVGILMAFYLIALRFMDKLDPKDDQGSRLRKASQYTKGFTVMSLLAVLALWLGNNNWASERGLGYAIFAILLGMLLGNTILTTPDRLPWLLQTANDGEFFIKCSLTLLAVELNVLVSVGAPGMLVAWIGSPLAIALGFVLGMRLFGCQDSLSMIIAVGAAWCGASAISAVAPIVSASSEDVTLAISVVAFFTIIFTFAQPYIAMAVGMPDDIAGSWIGSR